MISITDDIDFQNFVQKSHVALVWLVEEIGSVFVRYSFFFLAMC